MLNRIIEFGETAAFLRTHLEQMIVHREGCSDVSIPLADVSVVVVAHPQVTMTASLISEFLRLGGAFVFCDGRHAPAGMLLALEGNSVQQERFEAQAAAGKPLKKQAWQWIIRCKIRAQASVLEQLHGTDFGLRPMAARVRSGDTGNLEALAAQRYWPRLFGLSDFRRRREATDLNALLNYGYAVLRAIVGRAICAAGLHPSLGLHHANRYDAFCLADDLMEPYRPIVDYAVARIAQERGETAPLDKESKLTILSAMAQRFTCDGESRTIFDWLTSTTASLARMYLGSEEALYIPELVTHESARKKPVGIQDHVVIRNFRSAG